MDRLSKEGQQKGTEKHSEMLGQWDRNILEKGVKGVVEKILTDFNGQLPDVVVLPETSARPLMYAFRPIFKMLHDKQNVATPLFVFMNTTKPDSELSIAEQSKNDFEQWHTGAPTVDTSDELKEHIRSMHEDEETGELSWPFNEDLIASLVEGSNPEGMKRARGTMKERAQEISAIRPGAKIAVIDEFVSNGNTFREIERAFSGQDMRFYAVFSEGFNASGTFVNYDRGGGNPDRKGGLKLSYSGEDAVGVSKQDIGDGEELKKYADAIRRDDDPEFNKRKRQLRGEMAAVGEKVAQTMAAELNKQT